MERLKLRMMYLVGLTIVAVAATLTFQSPAGAQGTSSPVGPSAGLGVHVLGGTVQVSGGVVGVSGAVAAAQSGEWVVRTVEQAYTEDMRPSCGFGNRCVAVFTAVPADMSLRVTNLHGVLTTGNDAFVALRTADNISVATMIFAERIVSINGGFYGGLLTFNTATDIIFTAGQTPVLEIGNAAGVGLPDNAANLVGITGTLISAP
jgi:hypothetical protein